jgi:hypothetical protein
LQESVILRGMPAAYGIRLVMDMPGRIMRVDDQPVDVRRAEMKNASFMMIDPDDGMIVIAHDRFLLNQHGRIVPGKLRGG